MAKKTWSHPTHQRAPDEARTRLGNRSKIIHVRLSEPEYAALQMAMVAAGKSKLSRYVRSILLQHSGQFVAPVERQAIPFAGEPTGTTPAQAGDSELESWLRQHHGDLTEADLFGPVTDTSRPLVTLVDAPVLAPVYTPGRLPDPDPSWDAIPAPPAHERSQPAPAMPAWYDRAPTPEQVASVGRSGVSLGTLRELRSIMGDDSHVDPAVRAALALAGADE